MYSFWSLSDIQKLKDMYIIQGLSLKEIYPVFLNRTKDGIKLKIKKLKLRHTKEQTKDIKSRLNKGQMNAMFGKKGPNKGLTKNNSERIKIAGQKISLEKKNGFKTGKYKKLYGTENPMHGCVAWSKGLTKLTNNKLLEASKKQSITMKALWRNLSEEEKEKKSIFLASLFKHHKKGKKHRTSIEIIVQSILEKLKVNFEPSQPIGRFFADFYIPDYNSVIECFGDYWHCNPLIYKTTDKYQSKNLERDLRKITYLKNKNIPLLILWERDIKNQSYDIQSVINNFLKEKLYATTN